MESSEGIRAKSEEAVGDLAQALLQNPLFSQALGRALSAGEKAMGAQKSAMGAIDVANRGDLERLERRVRSLSERLERVEDSLDSIAEGVAELRTEGRERKAP